MLNVLGYGICLVGISFAVVMIPRTLKNIFVEAFKNE